MILKHYNKLTESVRLEVASPFEQFLRMGDIQDGNVIEITKDKAIEIGKSINKFSELPPRDPSNDNPNKKLKKQKEALKKLPKVSKNIAKRKEARKRAYNLRCRATAVNLELLPIGRQPDHVRKEWEKKLYKLEKEMGFDN